MKNSIISLLLLIYLLSCKPAFGQQEINEPFKIVCFERVEGEFVTPGVLNG